MTVEAWLRSRTPPPPPALLERAVSALGSAAAKDASEADTVCLDAAVRLLEPLLREDRPGRESALDLLAADALTTYAFEAAGAELEHLDDRTVEAMRQLAGLAPGGERPPRSRE
jgi:hypothetical protein